MDEDGVFWLVDKSALLDRFWVSPGECITYTGKRPPTRVDSADRVLRQATLDGLDDYELGLRMPGPPDGVVYEQAWYRGYYLAWTGMSRDVLRKGAEHGW